MKKINTNNSTKYQPKNGEWVILINTETPNRFEVVKYNQNYKGFDVEPFNQDNLPSYLK